jgi:hypothetical protein
MERVSVSSKSPPPLFFSKKKNKRERTRKGNSDSVCVEVKEMVKKREKLMPITQLPNLIIKTQIC